MAVLLRAASNEFSMDESDLFDSEMAAPGKHEDFSEDEDAHDAIHRSSGQDLPGGQSESAKSSTLGVTLEDRFSPEGRARGVSVTDAAGGGPACAQAMPMMSGHAKAQQHQSRFQAQSMPYRTGPCLHGTSVPVNIPFMMRGTRSPMEYAGVTMLDEDEREEFVPPHQLSQRNPVMFSLHGESPATAFRRERLKARDVILKSTGFVERHTGSTPQMIPSSGEPPALRSTPRSSLDLRGGLSQALNHAG